MYYAAGIVPRALTVTSLLLFAIANYSVVALRSQFWVTHGSGLTLDDCRHACTVKHTDGYVATILSAVENAALMNAAAEEGAFTAILIGAMREDDGTVFRWVTGLLGTRHSGAGTPFWQTDSDQTGGGPVGGMYARFDAGEPNDYFWTIGEESRVGVVGLDYTDHTASYWVDLKHGDSKFNRCGCRWDPTQSASRSSTVSRALSNTQSSSASVEHPTASSTASATSSGRSATPSASAPTLTLTLSPGDLTITATLRPTAGTASQTVTAPSHSRTSVNGTYSAVSPSLSLSVDSCTATRTGGTWTFKSHSRGSVSMSQTSPNQTKTATPTHSPTGVTPTPRILVEHDDIIAAAAAAAASAQQFVTPSSVIAVAVLSLDVSTASTMLLVSELSCDPSGGSVSTSERSDDAVRAASAMQLLISPFYSLGYVSMAVGNLLLAIGLALVHAAVTAVKSRAYIRRGRSLCQQFWLEASGSSRFPAYSYLAADALLPGVALGAVAVSVNSASTAPTDVVLATVAMCGVALYVIGVGVFLMKSVVPRCFWDAYVDRATLVRFASPPCELEQVLYPEGRWGPKSLVAAHGTLMTSMTARWYSLANVARVLNVVLGIANGLRDTPACGGVLWAVCAVQLCAGVGMWAARPFRHPAACVLAPLGLFLASGTCALKAAAVMQSSAPNRSDDVDGAGGLINLLSSIFQILFAATKLFRCLAERWIQRREASAWQTAVVRDYDYDTEERLFSLDAIEPSCDVSKKKRLDEDLSDLAEELLHVVVETECLDESSEDEEEQAWRVASASLKRSEEHKEDVSEDENQQASSWFFANGSTRQPPEKTEMANPEDTTSQTDEVDLPLVVDVTAHHLAQETQLRRRRRLGGTGVLNLLLEEKDDDDDVVEGRNALVMSESDVDSGKADSETDEI